MLARASFLPDSKPREAERQGRVRVPVQAKTFARELASSWAGFAGGAGGEGLHGAQRRLVVPLFTTSSVTGAGLPLLHAFLSQLQPTVPAAPGALQVCASLVCERHARQEAAAVVVP